MTITRTHMSTDGVEQAAHPTLTIVIGAPRVFRSSATSESVAERCDRAGCVHCRESVAVRAELIWIQHAPMRLADCVCDARDVVAPSDGERSCKSHVESVETTEVGEFAEPIERDDRAVVEDDEVDHYDARSDNAAF